MTTAELYRFRLVKLLERERLSRQEYEKKFKKLFEQQEKAQAQLDAEHKRLELSKQEPVVLVRTGAGPDPTCFHHYDRKCGWKPAQYKHMFLSEALAAGLKGCSSCASYMRAAS